jgi:hypothetical protein
MSQQQPETKGIVGMSEDEQATSIGKLMREWKASNEKMGAIEAEFVRQSENLNTLASLLARSRRVKCSEQCSENCRH